MKAGIRRLLQVISNMSPKTIYWIVAVTGVAFILLNVIRQFVYGTFHGDMLAQQLMVWHWMQGVENTLPLVEATNYYIKFPLYALLNLLPFSPQVILIFTSTLLTAAGWLIAWFFMSKITVLLRGRHTALLILALCMLYIAIRSDAVYWILYPNSRNIEVGLALGVLWVTLSMLIGKLKWSYLTIAITSFVTGLIFANDPLAMYLIAAPVGVYVLYRLVRGYFFERKLDRHILKVLAYLASSFIFYKLAVHYIVERLVTIPDKTGNINTPPAEDAVNVTINVIQGLLHENGANIFGVVVSEPKGIIQLLGVVFVGILIWVVFKYYKHVPTLRRQYATFLLVLLISIPTIAVVSGQIDGQTINGSQARYFIYVPFILILLAVLSLQGVKRAIQLKWIAMLLVAIVALVGIFRIYDSRSLVGDIEDKSWRQANQRLYGTWSVAEKYKAEVGYASIQIAQPISVFSEMNTQVIQIICSGSDDKFTLKLKRGWDEPASYTQHNQARYSVVEVMDLDLDGHCTRRGVLGLVSDYRLVDDIKTGKNHSTLVFEGNIFKDFVN